MAVLDGQRELPEPEAPPPRMVAFENMLAGIASVVQHEVQQLHEEVSLLREKCVASECPAKDALGPAGQLKPESQIMKQDVSNTAVTGSLSNEKLESKIEQMETQLASNGTWASSLCFSRSSPRVYLGFRRVHFRNLRGREALDQ